MDFGSLRYLWEAKPGAMILLVLGIVIFIFLVVDTWRHRKHHRHRRKH